MAKRGRPSKVNLDVNFENAFNSRSKIGDEQYKQILANSISNERDVEEFQDNLYLEIGDVRNIEVSNRLLGQEWDDLDLVPSLIIDLCRDPVYLHFVVKHLLNIDLLPYQAAWLQLLWTHQMPMVIGSRGSAKTFLGAIYLTLRGILHQGARIVVAGAGLRQSMLVFNYITQIWEKAPILRDICGNVPPKRDPTTAYWQIGDSQALFIPIGQGDKIRGLRATHILMEEFASIDPEIFEVVIQGFAAVRSQGVKNNVKEAYLRKYFAEVSGKHEASEEVTSEIGACPTILGGNQIILSGTPHFQFNHFYHYYKRYEAIILCGGDPKRIRENYPDVDIKDRVDSRQYCIIRMPVEALPFGLMDENIIAQAKAIMDPQIYMMEYGACFPSDSEGFIQASMIARATSPINTNSGVLEVVALLNGDRQKEYVMGIDPGSEEDNFTINICELNNNYKSVVYQWASNRKHFEDLKRLGGIVPAYINDFVSWCIFQIRNLRRRFNIIRICLDSSGGGVSIREALKDPTKLLDPQDELVFDMDDENVLDEPGSHTLKMIQFSNKEWRGLAHWGLRQDILDCRTIFPEYSGADIELAGARSKEIGVSYDTYEDNMLELEQLKIETIMIRMSQTANGGEVWDIPKVVGMNAEAMRQKLKRDRFTSLLLANWAGRLVMEERSQVYDTNFIGGALGDIVLEVGGSGRKYFGLGVKGAKHNFVNVEPEQIENPSGGNIYF